VNKIMCGLVAVTSLVVVCWLRFNEIEGILWFPIMIGIIATLNLG
jgi:hypothetical protein